jgi:putative ABC transport system substrate-binding protein
VKTRREFLIFGGIGLCLLAVPFTAVAQQQRKVWRIGFLGATSASSLASRIEALRAGLRELGYVEGKNLVIEFRWAEGRYDRLRDLAAELVHLRVDVIVTSGTPGTLAAKQATTTIPIVMATSGDAVGTGLVASLSRPGGNITGSTFFVPELMAKRLELLKEVRPRTMRVAVLVHSNDPSRLPVLKAMESASATLKVELQKFEVETPNELESTFSAMAKGRADGIVVQEDSMLTANAKATAELAIKQKIPLAGRGPVAEVGGLIGYGVDSLQLHRRAAYFVDRILKGAKPSDLPIERPTKFELIVNLKNAKALGITIPQSILVRADRVIE